jgi:hypothetical protein
MELRTSNMCLSEENSVYHHFQLDIQIDALSELTDLTYGHCRLLNTILRQKFRKE